MDDVFGIGGWKNNYKEFLQGIICEISCKIGDEWVTKSDGSEQTQIEALKGGLSASMKRAAVQWGIGRYLYKLEAQFVKIVESSNAPGATYINDKKNNVKGYWNPPQLPAWALPTGNNNNNQPINNNINKQKTDAFTTATNKKSNNGEFNREETCKKINSHLTRTGLPEKWWFNLFQQVSPHTKCQNYNDLVRLANEEELKRFYFVVKPVHDLLNISDMYKVSLEHVLEQVQILLPKVNVTDLTSCFTHVDKDIVRDVLEMVRGNISNNLVQTA